MKLHYVLPIISAVLFLGAGPAHAAPVDFLGSDHHHSDYSRDDGGDRDRDDSHHSYSSSGHHDDDWSRDDGGKDKKYSSGDGGGKSDWDGDRDHSWRHSSWHDDDDGDYKHKKYFSPEYGIYHYDHDHHGDKDRDDYHRYYKEICDRDDHGYKHHHPHDPDCDPMPLPAALPLFGASLMALVLARKTRRQRVRTL